MHRDRLHGAFIADALRHCPSIRKKTRGTLREFAGIVDRAGAIGVKRDGFLWNSVTQKPACSAISSFATPAAKFSFHESAR
jgi:hypothetical protein